MKKKQQHEEFKMREQRGQVMNLGDEGEDDFADFEYQESPIIKAESRK